MSSLAIVRIVVWHLHLCYLLMFNCAMTGRRGSIWVALACIYFCKYIMMCLHLHLPSISSIYLLIDICLNRSWRSYRVRKFNRMLHICMVVNHLNISRDIQLTTYLHSIFRPAFYSMFESRFAAALCGEVLPEIEAEAIFQCWRRQSCLALQQSESNLKH